MAKISYMDDLEPETIDKLFPELGQLDRESINAVKVIRGTDVFFDDMNVFEKCVLATNGIIPDFGFVEGCDPQHIWFTVSLASKLRPNKSYSWEVQKYCQYLFNEDGVYVYPPQFKKLDDYYFQRILNTLSDGDVPETIRIQRDKYLAIQLYIDRKSK